MKKKGVLLGHGLTWRRTQRLTYSVNVGRWSQIKGDPMGVPGRLLGRDQDHEAVRHFNLGAAYARGDSGLPQDERQAAHYYKLAADEGHAGAQFVLGLTYTRKVVAGCRRTIERPCASSSSPPTRGSRQRSALLEVTTRMALVGCRRTIERPCGLFKLAADQGDDWAQYSLGLFYAEGLGGLPQDEREAVRLFKLASDQGFAPAQRALGSYYANGFGGLPQDDREAVRPLQARR